MGLFRVDAKFLALQVGKAVDGLLRVEALAGPRSHGHESHPVLLEHVVEEGGLGIDEFHRLVVVDGHTRGVVEVVHRRFVAVDAEADLADLDLAGLHCALDRVELDQAVVSAQIDLQLAAALVLDLLDELARVLGEKAGLGIARGHGPGRLRLGWDTRADGRKCDRHRLQ